MKQKQKKEREWWNKKIMPFSWDGRTLGNKQK
jgi:hypothetical protein